MRAPNESISPVARRRRLLEVGPALTLIVSRSSWPIWVGVSHIGVGSPTKIPSGCDTEMPRCSIAHLRRR